MPDLRALRDPVTLTVGALAVHRLTRLVTADGISEPVRGWVADGHRERVAYFLACPWCVSVWAAAGWAAFATAAPGAAAAAGAVLAWSSVTGLLSSWE